MAWFSLKDPEKVLSPSLLFYKERIENNILNMIHMAGNADRLIPHVKTHKSAEIVKMQLARHISRFKCATIAEAEMIAKSGAKWVLIAYQLTGPNLTRLMLLRHKFPDVHFATLLDNEKSATELSQISEEYRCTSTYYIDINNGMNRSGHIADGTLISFYRHVISLPNLLFGGLHVYDGHIRNAEFTERKSASDAAFELILPLVDRIVQETGSEPMIIAGGSPSFTIHAMRPDVYLSPGTNVLWDWGYGDRFDDQPFLHAALILTRVVSKPAPGIVTTDLGHKAVSAENPIESRFKILNLTGYTVISQSEEHGVLEVNAETWENIQVGDILYALPYHICPTVALHEFAFVIEDGTVTGEWKIVARNRKITI